MLDHRWATVAHNGTRFEVHRFSPSTGGSRAPQRVTKNTLCNTLTNQSISPTGCQQVSLVSPLFPTYPFSTLAVLGDKGLIVSMAVYHRRKLLPDRLAALPHGLRTMLHVFGFKQKVAPGKAGAACIRASTTHEIITRDLGYTLLHSPVTRSHLSFFCLVRCPPAIALSPRITRPLPCLPLQPATSPTVNRACSDQPPRVRIPGNFLMCPFSPSRLFVENIMCLRGVLVESILIE